jgi:hypothetical protein
MALPPGQKKRYLKIKRDRHEKDASKIPYSMDSTRSIIDGKNKRKEFLFIPGGESS